MAVFYLYVTEGDISRLQGKHITPPKVAYHACKASILFILHVFDNIAKITIKRGTNTI